VILLLPLTLAWKLAVRTSHSADIADKEVQQRVAEFLMRQHFVVSVSAEASEGRPSIHATAGLCRMLIARSPTMGWDRDMVGRYATDADRVFVVFAGRIYGAQPTWLTIPDFLWARVRRELGFQAHAAPVLAVIAPPSCEAERLPWGEIPY
jgi:hypothetical protein